jgi:haloalkane dehalogenase
MTAALISEVVEVHGLRLHYTTAGTGECILLLHGWPTSAYLWRNVMPQIAANNRVIALDLPGFGKSDKPLDATYSFRFFDKILNGFLETLEIEKASLVVHDLGGPVGLFWACHHPERLERLAILNTLVYPEMSWAVVAFVLAARLPGVRTLITSPWGIRKAMQVGVVDRKRLTEEVVENYCAPFREPGARQALAKAGRNLSPKGFRSIAKRLPALKCPVRIVYGERDRILPDVAQTMARVQHDLPQAELFPLPDCGHFLQEERPEEIGGLLAEFFTA